MVSITTKLNKVKSLANYGGVCGWLLLLRPVLYFVFSRRRELSQYATVDASAMIFILYAFVAFFYALKELRQSYLDIGYMTLTKSPLVWFILYTILGFVSMIWSVDMKLSGFRAFECLSMILLMVATVQNIISSGSLRKLIPWILLYATIETLCPLIKKIAWGADLSQILESSQMVSTVFFYMAIFTKNKKWWHWLIIFMALCSGSTVSYIGMAIGLISFIWINRKNKVWVALGATIIVCAIIVLGPYKLMKETVFYDKEDISVEQTSGRDKIMDFALQSLQENNIGYGFFAGEPFLFYKKNFAAINGHNSFFSAMIGLGWPGTILMGIFLLGMVRITFSKYIPPNMRAPLIGCFCVGILQCMGNPGLGSRVYGAWMSVALLFITICSVYTFNKYYEIPDYETDE